MMKTTHGETAEGVESVKRPAHDARSMTSTGLATLAVSTDGTRLAVREWGNPQGPELLFIHGFSQSYLSFSKQTASELARDFRIIAFDLRGHGESDKPIDAAAYTDGERWAEDVASVIRFKALKHPVLVGWSMGGRVVAQYLETFGDAALGGIIFVSSRTVVEPGRDFLAPGAATLGAMQADDGDENIRATTAFLRECYATQPSEEDFRYMLAYNMLTPPHARRATQQWPGTFDDALHRVKVPVLVIHGTKDRIIQTQAAEFTAKVIPQARLVWIEGAGHSPFWEAPEQFNDAVRKFAFGLNRLTG